MKGVGFDFELCSMIYIVLSFIWSAKFAWIWVTDKLERQGESLRKLVISTLCHNKKRKKYIRLFYIKLWAIYLPAFFIKPWSARIVWQSSHVKHSTCQLLFMALITLPDTKVLHFPQQGANKTWKSCLQYLRPSNCNNRGGNNKYFYPYKIYNTKLYRLYYLCKT